MALRKTVGSSGFEIGRDKIAEQETKQGHDGIWTHYSPIEKYIIKVIRYAIYS